MVLQAVHTVLSIFVIIGVGMTLTHIGWLNKNNSKLLSNLVVKVALPATIISNLFGKFTRDQLMNSAVGILIPIISLLLTYMVSIAVERIIKIPKGRRGVFRCMFTFSNSVFVGVPVSTALFGEAAVPYALLYYIGNTVIFWTVGINGLCKDGQSDQLATPKSRIVDGLKRLLSIPLVCFVACFVLVLLNFRPPQFIMDASKYVGGMVTPLSLMYTGIIIMDMIKEKKVRWQKGYGGVLLGRFVIAPMILLGLVVLFPGESLMRAALLIQASMPVMAQTPIVAGNVGSDSEYGAGGIALTTLASLVFIPFYMWLIGCLGWL